MKPYLALVVVLFLAGFVTGFEYSESFSGISNSYIIYGGTRCNADSNGINCDFEQYKNYTIEIIFENDAITKDFCFLMTQSGLEPYKIEGLRTEIVRGLRIMCFGPRCDPVEIEDCFTELVGNERKAIRINGNTGSSPNNFHLRFYYKEVPRKDFYINFNPIMVVLEKENETKDEAVTTGGPSYSDKLSSLLSQITLLAKQNPKATAISLGILIAAVIGLVHYLRND